MAGTNLSFILLLPSPVSLTTNRTIFLLLFLLLIHAQKQERHYIDSLFNELKSAKDEANKVNLLNGYLRCLSYNRSV